MTEPQPRPGDIVLPTPEVPLCDFCSDRPVTWDYPCKNFTTRSRVPGFPHFNSYEGWAACDACHDLIQAGKRPELTARSVRKHPDRHRIPGGARTLQPIIRRIHDDFWRNREGEPKPVVGEKFDD